MVNLTNIIEILHPIFDRHGYVCEIIAPDEIRFVNTTDSININFDVVKPHLNKLKMTNFELRVRYAIRLGVYWIIIDPKLLMVNTVIETSLFYTNHDELVNAAIHLGKQAADIVLPFIEKVADYSVFPTDDLYGKLSQMSSLLVAEFALKYKLNFQATRENYDQIKTILESWIPTNPQEKQLAFESRTEDIIKLTAYIGDTIIKSYGGTWRWETVKRYGIKAVYSHEYFVCYCDSDGDQQKINFLYYVIMHWNLHNIVQFSGLDSPKCKKCFDNRLDSFT